MGEQLRYGVGEEVHLESMGLTLRTRQFTTLGKGWRDTRPHATGKGRYVAKYLGEGKWEWQDEMSHYELLARKGVSLSLKAINEIDRHLTEEYFGEIAKRLRVEPTKDRLYVVDGEFRIDLYNDYVDAFEVVGAMTVMECHDV